MQQPYDRAGPEPRLADLFDDPIIHAVMRRDGVTEEELCRVIRTGQELLGLDADEADPAWSWPPCWGRRELRYA